jgi:protein-disulfide isomerase
MTGKEIEMQEWLYSHQPGLTREAVREAAANIAGVRNFDQEYARQLSLVRQDAEMGGRLKIDGTPTFFINGVRVPGALRAEYLDAAVMHELRRAGAATP